MKRLSIIFTSMLLLMMSSSSFAGGFLIVMPNKHSNPDAYLHSGDVNPALFPLETRSTQIKANIFEQTATTTIKQVFYNPTGRRLEAYFLFPVPENVVINDFKMNINGKMQAAELLDATKARQIYEQIVRRAKDPALLEYYDQKMFRVRIFPIEPNSEQRIELTYSETLKKDNETIAYHFPLNTAKYAAKPLKNLSLSAVIEGKNDLKTVYCPTHEAEIIRKGQKKASLGFELTNVRPDRDFQLYFNMDNSKIGLSSLNYQKGKEDGYFFLNVSPGFVGAKEIVAKDVVFVMDKSGSMSGEKMEQAQKALKFCINNLNKGDRFEVIPFSTEATALFGQVKEFNKENKAAAIEFIEDLKAIGGTNIDEALELAMQAQKTKSDRPFFVIFMTDGKPTVGETGEASLIKKVKAYNKENVRIFTFGIGVNLNTHLLDKLTEISNGYRTYVLEDEDIEVKVSDFYAKASSPVLTDLKVDFDRSLRVSDVYPKKLPDLFKGSTLSLMGRYKGHGKTKITVSGKMNGKEQKFVYHIDFEKDNTEYEFVPNLWAARTVGYLLDQIRLHGESSELKEEVIRLAKKHGIITPYTSYLILEDEALASSTRNIQPSNQLLRPRTLNAPTIEADLALDEVEKVVTTGSGKKKSGASGVRASKEIQTMNMATNIGAVNQGSSRLQYTDKAGAARNLGDNIVKIGGRAMYSNNNIWLDAAIALDTGRIEKMKVNRIQFNSKEYFNLMRRKGANEFLALGRNVRFKMDDEIFEISE